MKAKGNITIKICAFVLLSLFYSCKEDFLDIAPQSSITPENYLFAEDQLDAYAINRYSMIKIYDWFEYNDLNTDFSAGTSFSGAYVPGQSKVPQSGGSWSFNDIYTCNYFLQTVLPRWKAGKITGNIPNINHSIGEIYFFRAYAYFEKLKALGDFPIIRSTLPDDQTILTEASKRAPMNEVARFIISDLDSAIMLMKPVSPPDGKNNRLSQNVAQLFKSRVALFEATWLKYFKGTAFVPNGPGWPGKDKDYNASYKFPTGSIDGEIDYFFTQAMASSKIVANSVPLVANSMTQQSQATYQDFAVASDANPYCRMFSQEDLSAYKEVLLWRRYSQTLGVTNGIVQRVQAGYVAWTRGYVDNFLMANGLPIYASGSGYAGDDFIADVRKNRDGRCWLFLSEPDQINILYQHPSGTHARPIVKIPNIAGGGDVYQPTGYVSRKGNNYDAIQLSQSLGGYVGSIAFRAVEAHLNYMEACYEKTGALDATAQDYWKAIRNRAGVDPDFQKTINATDMSQEAKNNWSAYSAGQLIDATLYNIRRERGCEFSCEGYRFMDLTRWRAMDQMITTPYHIEGFKLWGPMQGWYSPSLLTYGIGDASKVSAPSLSPYIRLYQKTPTSLAYNGFRWAKAHYLNPIAVQHFLDSSSDGADVTTSPIYQNPGWPIQADMGATF
jgi:hypothetical protein